MEKKVEKIIVRWNVDKVKNGCDFYNAKRRVNE
jgi:hypothetical protein